MKNPDILVVGSIAFDTIKTPFGEKKEILGGSATYFSYAASLFAPVNLLGIVGSDFPEKEIRKFEKRGIDTSGLQVRPGKTFRWSGRYGKNLKEARTVSVALNVMDGYSPKLPEQYRNSQYLFLANIDPETQLKTLKQVDSPKIVVCDTMNLWIKTKLPELKKLLEKVDVLLLNDEEARMLTGQENLRAAGRDILKLGPKTAIIKKGAHGVIMISGKDDFFFAPAFPTTGVSDPTGAGDSFGGGFTGYIAARNDFSTARMHKALFYGAAVASFTVEGFGLKALEKISVSNVEHRVKQIKKLIQI
ncbi:MAG: PfkB family carbohydrate kinase [Candidatus Omnitrophica bacterium]|nr:PfkB family carbohydrate kinase [Candidatus Omnitrophota bacterium]